MKLGTAIVGIFVISAFIIPILLFYRMRIRKEKLIRKAILNSSLSKGTRIMELEIWDHMGIALSENGLVFSIEDHRLNPEVKVIDLNLVSACNVIHKQNVNENQEKEETVSLVFMRKGNQVTNDFIEFYNSRRMGGILSGQLQMANKWQAILTSKQSTEIVK